MCICDRLDWLSYWKELCWLSATPVSPFVLSCYILPRQFENLTAASRARRAGPTASLRQASEDDSWEPEEHLTNCPDRASVRVARSMHRPQAGCHDQGGTWGVLTQTQLHCRPAGCKLAQRHDSLRVELLGRVCLRLASASTENCKWQFAPGPDSAAAPPGPSQGRSSHCRWLSEPSELEQGLLGLDNRHRAGGDWVSGEQRGPAQPQSMVSTLCITLLWALLCNPLHLKSMTSLKVGDSLHLHILTFSDSAAPK